MTDATEQKQLEHAAVLVHQFKVCNTNLLRANGADYFTNLWQSNLDYFTKDQWTPDSPNLNALAILWLGTTLEAIISVIQSRRRSSDSRKHCRLSGTAWIGPEVFVRLASRWNSLMMMMMMNRRPIDKAVKKFPKWPKACNEANGGHFEHSQWLQNSDLLLLLFEWRYLLCIRLNVLECAKITRWQCWNADNFKTV